MHLGRASTPEVGLYHDQGNGVGTWSPTWITPINGHGQQFDICFPGYYQVPIDVTAEWAAFLVNTRSSLIQLGGLEQIWVKFLALGNTKNTKVTTTANQTHNLLIRRPKPRQLSYSGSHTHTHTHTHTQTHTHTRARTHTCITYVTRLWKISHWNT